MEYNFFTEKHLQFEQDFESLCTHEFPIYILIDDMTKSMDLRKEPFIEINKKYSADGRKHKFYFDIDDGKYVYSHCD